jgi:CheY-like chemotaxis protein
VSRSEGRPTLPLILVVDDDDEVREMIRAILEADGYHTRGATNGRNALHSLAHDRPDLILCDLVMPIMGGEDFWKGLWPYEDYRTIPIVFMTGDPDHPSVEALRGKRVVILGKPLDCDELLEIVRRFCRRGTGRGAGVSGAFRRLRGDESEVLPSSVISRGTRR